ncbi:MAG: erythromycin esterase family protein [Saprospiraceae bacterium]|nr:erythromycin esterase family protein [Saprospiraceae bacterium]
MKTLALSGLLVGWIALAGQTLDASQMSFIREHVVQLGTDPAGSDADWEPVISAIGDKQYVCLGEFNHGSREVFIARNHLIRALHQQLGFDLILFESGLGEVGVIEKTKDTLTRSALTSGFFGGWRTSEFADLIDYARQHDITVAGYDVQRTGRIFSDYLERKSGEPGSFAALEQRFVQVKSRLSNYRTEYHEVAPETEDLIARYRAWRDSLDWHDPLVEQTLTNRIRYLAYMLDFVETKDWNARWAARDQAMADNVQWLLQQYGRERKAIIVGHNFHIARRNDREEVMGEFLRQPLGQDMFVIGVFAAGGTFHNNAGKPEQMSPADTTMLDIKHVIHAASGPLTFLAIPEQVVQGSEWLFEPIAVHDTFIDLSGSDQMTLSQAFDALLLLDRVTPPKKEDTRR